METKLTKGKTLFRQKQEEEQQTTTVGMQSTAKLKPGVCPNCGAHNDPAALFCEECGTALRESVCPCCGEPVDAGVDFCESCNQYIAEDRCSFCSSAMTAEDRCCPECGASREGIECPVCHTMSRFPFCPKCGTAITDAAKDEQKKAWDVPFLHQMLDLTEQLEQLWMTAPAANGKQRRARERNIELRKRVLELLKEDGEEIYPITREPQPIMDEAQLEDIIAEKRNELQRLLDRMAMPEQESPAKARIFSMARKPGVTKLGWKCNYKHALHSSPLGCACPQMGGKWIVLNSDNIGSVQDDK